MTTENLSERVSELEKSVKRAAEGIALLRKERDALQAKLTVMEGERGELQALKHERKEVLAQVDSILKELDKLDL
jgi:septal ring factor EnvC (AmiA/AmiB activator)